MKTLKRIFIGIISVILVSAINCAGYLYFGQQKSMSKFNAGQKLNLYECCSIYSIHLAACTLGWFISPEAAEQCVLMAFAKEGSHHLRNSSFMKSEYIRKQILSHQSSQFTIDFPLNEITSNTKSSLRKELRYAIAFDGARCVDVDGECTYCLDVTAEYSGYTARYTIGAVSIVFYWQLQKYIQDKGWLHKVYISYIN